MSNLIDSIADQSLTATVDEARRASEAQDWPRAAALWDELRAAQPQNPYRWLKAGEAYGEARMLEIANRILGEAVMLFPHDRWIAHRYTMIARYAADWPEVLKRAEHLRRTDPDFWRAWVEAAHALTMLGRNAEADEMSRKAVERFPDEFWTNYAVARLKAKRGDAHGAVRVWTELVDRFPAESAGVEALRAASEVVARQDIGGAGKQSPEGQTPRPADPDLTKNPSLQRLFRRTRRR